MYSVDYLSRFPYFQHALHTEKPASLHDSLTGVIARPYMLGFIQDLVARELPFMLAIMDLDNFKRVNDHYGHKAGDHVLADVARELKSFLGEDGVVGRYGGDEFLLVYFGSVEYDKVHAFYMRMYCEGSVLRRELSFPGGGRHYLTATIGSAFFPNDAPDFDTLFSLVDKALYRGKSKGRNCFIIYVASKHAQLQIPGLSGNSIYETLREMTERFDSAEGFNAKMYAAYQPFRDAMHLGKLLYLDSGLVLHDPETGDSVQLPAGLSILRSQGIYAPTPLEELAESNPVLLSTLQGMGLEAALFARIGYTEDDFGCLVVCPLPYTKHIWQDSEYTLSFSLSRMLSQLLRQQE